jgi:hypothetical protein
MCVCVAGLIAALALTVVAPAHANAASAVLEFVPSGGSFPIEFKADGGEVTAALDGYDTVVHCTGSEGEGEIRGPRSTLSHYVFTGCKTQGGTEGGQKCNSVGANAEEIRSEEIEADLVYIDQAKHEVGMLLNPGGGAYMSFECGTEGVEALGPFLSPVGPINQQATSFTAALFRSGATQTPSEYENALGEKRLAIPMGKREAAPSALTTGVELSFTIQTSAPLQIRAVTAAEIEAKRREDEAAAAAAAKKRQEEEAAAAVAAGKRQREEARLERIRHKVLSIALTRCRKVQSKHKRMRCERRAKKKYGSQNRL